MREPPCCWPPCPSPTPAPDLGVGYGRSRRPSLNSEDGPLNEGTREAEGNQEAGRPGFHTCSCGLFGLFPGEGHLQNVTSFYLGLPLTRERDSEPHFTDKKTKARWNE